MCWKGNKVDRLKTTTGGETNKQPKIGRLQAWKGAHDRAYSRIAHGPACTHVQTSHRHNPTTEGGRRKKSRVR
jgi:hypothetical protein